MKIGGAVLNKPQNFSFLFEIITKHCTSPTIFVFSAFSDLSRKLRQSARIAKSEGLDPAMQYFAKVKQQLFELVKSLFTTDESANSVNFKLNVLFESFEKILFGIAITKELTKRTLDRVLSFGEYFSSIVLEEFLKSKCIDAIFLDSSKLIITDTNYGNAKPILDRTAEAINRNLLPHLEKSNLVFLPGFIGSSEIGTITTMGFESSNLTALLIASIVEADSVTFWTDVEGIRTSDPKIVENTQLVPEVSFDDALLASYNGIKLVHPSMYEFFVRYPNIKYIYKSAFSPNNGETQIVQKTNFQPKFVLISEPYYFIELNDEKEKDYLQEGIMYYTSKDYSFLLTEEFPYNEINKKVNVLTLFYFEPYDVFEALNQISNKVRFVISNVRQKIYKILVEEDYLIEVANFLHNFLILKNK